MQDERDEAARLDALFDDDYLDFYAAELNPTTSDDEAELIALLTGLEPGCRVLDAPCGHGRIAKRLAQRGCEVVGVDRSALFVQRARDEAERRGAAIDYRVLDLRELPFTDEFDLVVNWFTSFGYGSDDDLRHVLWRLHRALRPGGQLLLETLNIHEPGLSDHETDAVKHLHDDTGDHFLIDRARFDPHDGRLHVRRFVQRADRPTRELTWSLRLFTLPELRDWLHTAGFEQVRAYGGEGEVFRVDSGRLVVTAHKPPA